MNSEHILLIIWQVGTRFLDGMHNGCNWTKYLKNQPCDVINMREMRGEVGKKDPNKEMDNLSFL